MQARERDTNALATAADHLGLVAVDLGDRAAKTERRSSHWIADGERRGERRRLVERAQPVLDSRGARRCGAQTAISLALGTSGRGRRVARRFSLRAACGADLLAQSLELGPRLARSRSASAIDCSRAWAADARTS
jgi:hypothetical protein